VSVRLAKGAWEVRWRDASGRHRAKRFQIEEAAREFDASVRNTGRSERRRSSYGREGGVYAYETAAATRWRCSVPRGDGTFTSKRGFTSRQAALDARRRLLERQATAASYPPPKRDRCREFRPETRSSDLWDRQD
jgi:hypothetical protein